MNDINIWCLRDCIAISHQVSYVILETKVLIKNFLSLILIVNVHSSQSLIHTLWVLCQLSKLFQLMDEIIMFVGTQLFFTAQFKKFINRCSSGSLSNKMQEDFWLPEHLVIKCPVPFVSSLYFLINFKNNKCNSFYNASNQVDLIYCLI